MYELMSPDKIRCKDNVENNFEKEGRKRRKVSLPTS
jgi:hypothetical protein